MIGLDTNVIVRYLVQDDPVQAEIATRISEGAFGSLAAPVRRLAMPDIPVPSARELERCIMPSAASIADAARDLAMVV